MRASAPLVVEVERSGLIESTHLVDVAVVTSDGTISAWAGEPQVVAYLRSSAKPVQATACLASGWTPPGTQQVAIACASHNGEPVHVDAARRTLEAAGLEEEDLRCPEAWPARPKDAAAAREPARIFHNCSGKHAAMLAACVVNDWDRATYVAPGHPLQRAVTELVSALAGRPPRTLGVDGCGVPTYAFTLAESARAFAALPGSAAPAVAAMREHPHLVAGSDRLCTAIMASLPGVVVKIGAEGLLCGVSTDLGIAFALKSRDGTPRGRDAAAVHVLQELGAFGDGDPGAVLGEAIPRVTGGGEPAGSVRSRGGLKQA